MGKLSFPFSNSAKAVSFHVKRGHSYLNVDKSSFTQTNGCDPVIHFGTVPIFRVRTMINLTAAGAMDRCATFAKPLQPELIPQLLMKSKSTRSFAFENLKALKAAQKNSSLAIALEACIERNLPRQFIPGAL